MSISVIWKCAVESSYCNYCRYLRTSTCVFDFMVNLLSLSSDLIGLVCLFCNAQDVYGKFARLNKLFALLLNRQLFERSPFVNRQVFYASDLTFPTAAAQNFDKDFLLRCSEKYSMQFVIRFDIRSAQLLYFPFPSLEILELSFNEISFLPELPETLICLRCKFNKLKMLPNLPSRMEMLQVSSNLLTKLPPLPKTLEMLVINDNPIEELETIPSHLIYVDTRSTKLPQELQMLKVPDTSALLQLIQRMRIPN